MVDLSETKCEQDPRRIFAFEEKEIKENLSYLWGWREEDEKLQKSFPFADFMSGLIFISKIIKLAEQEKQKPIITLEQTKVEITLYTQEIDSLSKNDFIFASKIDKLLK